MPERLEKLRTAIEDLERELSGVEQVDPATREALETALGDIQAALQKQDPSHLDQGALEPRLNSALEHFEASHPALASMISRIIDTLGQIGI